MNSGFGASAADGRQCQAIRTLLLVAALVFLARGVEARDILHEVIEQKHAIDADATLSIHNTDGSITVHAGDSAEISIRATKKAYTSDRLKSIAVDVKATSNGIAIDTILPPKNGPLSLEDRSGTVDYSITAPKTIRITRINLINGEVLVDGLRGGSAIAQVRNGWLVARNCFGDLDLSITNGRLQVAYDWWEDTKFRAKLSTPEGDIRALVPRDASANIVARTTTGRILNGLAKEKEEASAPLRALNFTVGLKPWATFEMSSISGDIRINKPY